jgi:glycine/serine hydroxymethyltransferase
MRSIGDRCTNASTPITSVSLTAPRHSMQLPPRSSIDASLSSNAMPGADDVPPLAVAAAAVVALAAALLVDAAPSPVYRTQHVNTQSAHG